MNTLGFPFKLACLAAAVACSAHPVRAGGTVARNPPECDPTKEDCGCDGAEVSAGCIKVNLDLGETTPWTGSMPCALKVFADERSPAVFTAESLYAVLGGYTFKRLGPHNLPDGVTPAEVVMAHPQGEPVHFVFSDGESVARPDPGVHIRMDERLMMVDAEGWAATSNPVYYDLYVGDGTRRRFLATNATGALGRLVSVTDARGVTVTPADMGVDIIYDSNGVRQFLTPSRLANVTHTADWKGYDVAIYAVQAPPAKDPATGLYAVPETTPAKRLSVRSQNDGRRAAVTLRSGGGEPQTYVFDYAFDDWSLARPSGVEERKERMVADERAASIKKEVVSPAGGMLSRTVKNYKWEPWGFAMTNRVDGFGGVTDTTEWTYHTSGNGRGQVKTERRQSGLLVQYAYDNADRVVSETRSGPGMMTEATTYSYTPVDPGDPVLPVDTRPRTVVKTLDGVECERTYYVYSPLTNIVERVGTQGAPYGGTNALRTVTAFYPVNGEQGTGNGEQGWAILTRPCDGRIASVRHEDGRLDLYDYALVSNLWTEIVTHLHEQSPAPVSGKTTRDITQTNARGEVAETRTEAYIDGVWHIIARERRTYNAEGKVVRRENLAGQVTTTEWDCCHKISETQPDGSTTTWDYDDDGRMIASSRLIPLDMTNVTWLTTCYAYDDLDRQTATWQTNYAAQVGLPVERTTYDALGRVVSRIDTLGNTTTTTYSPDGRTVSVLNPNTATRITTRSPNGNLLSITGTAVTPEFHTYGITNLCVATAPSPSYIPCRVHETRFGSATSARFTRSYENLLGQTIREERSGFQGALLATTHAYDSYGRLVRTSPNYEPTVEHSYDITGARSVSVRSADGQWRKTETTSAFATIDGVIWLTQSNIVSCSDTTIAPLVTSTSRQLTGLTAALPSRSRSTDVRGNVAEEERLVSSSLVTSRQTVPYATNQPLSISRYGIDVMDVSVSAVTNTYAYDSLGRQIAHTDGRGNTTHTEYNALDQRSASIDALGNRTTYAYDQFGNLAAVTNPLGKAIVYEYDLRGRKTYEGGATYPVRYTYDVHDQRTSLSTTRNGETWDTTTWTFDPATGNCLSKTYADNSTVTYTYTPDNLPLRTTYASGKWKENVYDAQRRLCGVVYSSRNMDYELQLDVYGNATNVEDSAGNSWRYGYGVNSLLLGEIYIQNDGIVASQGGPRFVAATNNILRSYDPFDRPIGFIFSINDEPKGGIGYNYDDDGDLVRIAATNATGRSFSVVYTNVAGYSYGYTITTPNGDTIRRVIDRDDCRRSLVTNCATYFNSFPVDSNAYVFDALSRPITRTTGTTGILPVASTFAYNDRSEVLSATIGTNLFTHAYDDIGNHLLFGDNTTTNTFTHNQVNQMVGRGVLDAPLTTTFIYTPDGGLSSDGTWAYAYGVEDQLTSVTSSSLTNGAIRVHNTHDYRKRRTSKTVQRLHVTSAPPPAPPSEEVWETVEKRTFVYDDWNLIHETISVIDGGTTNITEVQYFWGLDLSDSLQGAGGVGGLLAVSRNGHFYFPAYDNNGNVTKYIDESGNIAAAYEYDDFGRTISQSGPLADFFRHRFSTKYYDAETGLYYYGIRFYAPNWRIWLNRDPLGEQGGVNLYVICRNASSFYYDEIGARATSPFTFVGDPMRQIGNNGFYLGLWYPLENTVSLFYALDISVKWGDCDGCKPDETTYAYTKQISFWENQRSRRMDVKDKKHIYLNLVNTDIYEGGGFKGKMPDGTSAFQGTESSFFPAVTATWGNVAIKINWYAVDTMGPDHLKIGKDHSVLWHEFQEKKDFPYNYVPKGIQKRGVQTIKVKWSCNDESVTLTSDPLIENGPQRKDRARWSKSS